MVVADLERGEPIVPARNVQEKKIFVAQIRRAIKRIYMDTGILYLGYQIFSGNYRQVLFTPRDIPGVWPMVKHYFFGGPKPPVREAYNPLQKHAYTTAIGLGVLSVLTGLVVWKVVCQMVFAWACWSAVRPR